MRGTKAWTWALTAAGLLQIGLALAHFSLPTVFEWSSVGSGRLPSITLWALLALNYSWSTLVLLVGSLAVYAARPQSQHPIRAGGGPHHRRVLDDPWPLHGDRADAGSSTAGVDSRSHRGLSGDFDPAHAVALLSTRVAHNRKVAANAVA
jgi:hypothetical protein